jgi:hypothetical protein
MRLDEKRSSFNNSTLPNFGPILPIRCPQHRLQKYANLPGTKRPRYLMMSSNYGVISDAVT